MKEQLKVLICEDTQHDAELLTRQLEQDNYNVDYLRVDTMHALKDALISTSWDIIISDYNISGFSIPEALNSLKELGLDIPFILISGSIHEETAVYMIKAGVRDCLTKDNLSKLGVMVRRELEDGKRRRQFNTAIEQIKVNEKRYRAIVDSSLVGIIIGKVDGSVIEANKAACDLFGYSPEELRSLTRYELLNTSDPELTQKLKERSEKKGAYGIFKGIRKNGEKFYCEISSVMYNDINGEDITCSMVSDISLRIQAESQLKQTNLELSQLSNHLKNARENERKYIAREIHDELGQLASVIKIELDWLSLNMTEFGEKHKSRINYAITAVTEMINSTRRICSSLRPHIIDQQGLNAALQWQCREFEKLNSIGCIFTEDFDDSEVTLELQTELYRICQEALTNVMRHAMATEVLVKICKVDEQLVLTVKDNGKGFDTGKNSNHLGLIGLRERAIAINGKLQIDSAPGKGTTINVIVLLKNETI
ncbi:MAG: PAS domain S-box protein [Sediminibacterium sp.]